MNPNVENFLNAKNALEEHNGRIKQLDEKQAELNARVAELAIKIPQAKAAKNEAIDDFLLGRKSESAAQSATADLGALEAEKVSAEELLLRIKQKIGELVKLSPGLARKADQARRVVWNPVSDEMSEKIQKEIYDRIQLAFTINKQRGMPRSYAQYLEELFPLPNEEQLKRFNPKLDDIFRRQIKS